MRRRAIPALALACPFAVAQESDEGGGYGLTLSEPARRAGAATFQRRPGESDRDACARWQAATVLPQDRRDARKGARWRVELEARVEEP